MPEVRCGGHMGISDRGEMSRPAYCPQLADNPILTRTLFVDILHLGLTGQQARRRVFNELAEFIVQVARPSPKRRSRLGRDQALALVGAINELVLERLENEASAAQAAKLLEALAPLCAPLVHPLSDCRPMRSHRGS